jgi:dolichol-phosphate mannosyltransferase
VSAAELAYRLGAAARRPASWWQLLKFGLVGASGYLINLAVFAVLSGNLGVHHAIAAVGAFCVAVSSNFFWNRHWTFGAGDGHAGFQAARFFAVSLGALLINLVVLEALIAGAGVGDLSAQAIAVAVAMPFNFLGNKLWTFAQSPRA